MTHAVPRPIEVALGCFLFAGGLGVAGTQMPAVPASSVRVAAAPSTTVTTEPPTTTSTTLAPTTTTLATMTTVAPQTTTSTTTAKRSLTRVRPVVTTIPVACSITIGYPDGQMQVTAHVPSVPNGQLRIGLSYDDLDPARGGISTKWGATGTDANGNSGIVAFFPDQWIGQPHEFIVENAADLVHILCKRAVMNADGTPAVG